ncbi:MAG TPA: FkbM family methyltransferase [Acidimicrobiales bacterium]|nr:FkbM family methyltransferase [Acidimicrobiales bacterium]
MTTSTTGSQSLPRQIEYILRQIFANPGNKGERFRRTAEALMFPAWTRLTGGCWTTTYAGGHIMVRRGQGSQHAVYARLPDYPEMSFWLGALRPGDLFVDVGANIGLYSLLIASQGCDVISVEPAPEARQLLEANLGLNGVTTEIVTSALGREPGRSVLTAELGSMNYLVGDADEAGIGSGSVVEVQVATLDDLLGERTAAGVKVDVEGFELDVVLGASRALGEQRIGVVQLEWNRMARERYGRDRGEVASVLEGAGYVLTRPDAEGRLHQIVPDEGPDIFAVAPRLRGELVVAAG